jgi:hypothetical protein
MCVAATSARPSRQAMATSVQVMAEMLESTGHADFAIVGPTGEVCGQCGLFEDPHRAAAASAVLQACVPLLKPSEKLRKVTIVFEESTFVATIATIGGKPHGIIIKKRL